MTKPRFRWKNGMWRLVVRGHLRGDQVIGCCMHCKQSFVGHWLSRSCPACRETHYARRSRAGAKVAQAIRRGELAPAAGATCVDCGAPARDYDHRDYDRPLDVVPVCRGCNKRRGPAIWKAA